MPGASTSSLPFVEPKARPSGLRHIALPVLGMSCASCQRHVETALRGVPGVSSAHVDLMSHRAAIEFDARIATPEGMVQAIRGVGYDAVLSRSDASPMPSDEGHGMGAKAATAIVAGCVAMVVAMPLGVGMGAGATSSMGAADRLMMGLLPWLYAASPDLLRRLLLGLTAAVMMWAGRIIYASAWSALRHGISNMNTLVSLGTGIAFLYSAAITIWPAFAQMGGRQATDTANVYYDAVLLILGFLLLGKWLEARARKGALAAITSLARLQPANARLDRDGVQSVVPLDQVRPGERVVVLPGERFPVDGTVLEGRTTVDESMLTGESTPLPRGPGEKVLAGAMNYEGAIVCKAESLGEQTVLAQITRLVGQAQSSRAPMERLADRAGAIFVPVVLGLAAVTFVTWLLATHSLPPALASTVAVLVIACPCAMGLAVPAALTVAIGRGAQLGVLFKGGEALERLAQVDTVALDKTGTLTVGRPQLTATYALGVSATPATERSAIEPNPKLPNGFSKQDLLRIAAAAEERSGHPLAHAIVDAAKAQGLTWAAATEAQSLPGRGLTATVEGHSCAIGNAALLQDFGIALPTGPHALAVPAPGITRLWMALDNQIAACFEARDQLRADAPSAMASLQRDGLRLLMLTGDSALAAKPIAEAAGVQQVVADADPAQKLAHIRDLQQQGRHVAMVGDGVNDAAALAQANAGIAMGTGADLAKEAGDVLLVRSEPGLIPAAIELARATVRVMHQNLGWAIGYNLLGIPLAAGALYPAFHVLLSPWVAAVAMALSSLSVLANSLRLRGWKPKRHPDNKPTLQTIN